MWALGFALVATLVPPAGPNPSPVAQDVALVTPPRVTDPRPAPGSVIEAGPVVIAARVHGTDPGAITLLIDGEEATGLPADPDGGLTDLAGVETTIQPGPHRLAVAVGEHGVVREWDVVAVGVAVQTATEDVSGLARRLAPPVGELVVLANPADPALGVAAAPIAAMLGGTVLPTTRRLVPATTWAALGSATGDVQVVLLGGPGQIDPIVDTALATAGFATSRITGGSGPSIAAAGAAYALLRNPDPSRALVVGPAEPFDAALNAAVTAARLGAAYVMVGEEVSGATAVVIGRHEVVLISSALSPEAREEVTGALTATAVASEADLQQSTASEAVIVADAVTRDRALVASFAATSGRAVLLGSASGEAWVGQHRPDRVTVVGLPVTVPATQNAVLPAFATLPAVDANAAAAPPDDPDAPFVDPDAAAAVQAPLVEEGLPEHELRAALRRAWVDGPDTPRIPAVIDAEEGLQVSLTAPDTVSAAEVYVTVLGYEWPGDTAVDGQDVTWTAQTRPVLPLSLEPERAGTPTLIDVTVAVTTAQRTVHDRFTTTVPLDPRSVTSREGWTIAGGSTEVTGSGRLYTYSVEVEPETGLDVDEVEAEVSRILTDARSWTADGRVSFQRVGGPWARVRVVVARPATVDRFCGDAGLRTGGRVSCWDGFRTMLNLDRWTVGVPHFRGDLVTYREYLVNHEVGHGLGFGHVGCPRPGMLAPVMMQQTGGVGACQPNGWPFP